MFSTYMRTLFQTLIKNGKVFHLSRACSMASASLRATTYSLLRPSGDAAAASSLGNTYLQDMAECEYLCSNGKSLYIFQ